MGNFAVVADLHIHTISCGHAYSTVQENAAAAAALGLEMIAITDHGPSMPGSAHPYYFKNLVVIPRVIGGVRILRGVEANITNVNGDLDLPLNLLTRLDIVLAGLHKRTFPQRLSEEENTSALLKAIESPYVDVIVHPGNPLFPVNIEAVIAHAAKYGTAIELNNSSLTVTRTGSKANCTSFASLAAAYDTYVTLGSDAHISFDVGRVEAALAMAMAAGIKEERLLNTSCQRIDDYLAMRRKKREELV
jgi:putative hydrolase